MTLVGNKEVWEQLLVAKYSALKDKRPLPHTLLSGAAGCGKTSTARELAAQSGSQFLVIAPESIKTRDDVLNIIQQLDHRGYDRYGVLKENAVINHPILFVDEVHRMPITGQEHLGIVMEEWAIPVDARKIKTNIFDQFDLDCKDRLRWCPKFTMIGATTNDGLLSKPFKDRFKMRFLFNTYTLEESIEIVKSHASRLNISIEDGAAKEIAKRGRGVPRIIVGLLERCRDFMRSIGYDTLNTETTRASFLLFKIDDIGMTDIDVKILKALYNSNAPLGLDNLSVIVNESKQTIEETIEPYLIQQGFILRASRGRTITDNGKMYLIRGGYIEAGIDEADDWVDIPTDYYKRGA